ncbi:hypothetical protein GCM10010411_80950 [Actinomadura fulvescens]|uniref:Uncharacterized protein n=1 Tax=Actinomadura fulvescens TaxID=46160 RepID=A0ABN3QN54_9ACTN
MGLGEPTAGGGAQLAATVAETTGANRCCAQMSSIWLLLAAAWYALNRHITFAWNADRACRRHSDRHRHHDHSTWADRPGISKNEIDQCRGWRITVPARGG